MEHIVQFAIGIDDERIKARIEDAAEKQILDDISKSVKDALFEKRWNGNYERDSYVIREMAKEKVEEVIEENKEYILEQAYKLLADKLARSKAGKALLDELKESEE